jgi:outer membrane protein
MPHGHRPARPVAGLLLLVAFAANGAAQDPPTTLRELALKALESNESIGRADSQIRRAQADVRLSTSVLMPRLELNAGWTRYDAAQTIEFAPGDAFTIRPLNDWSWSADLRQTLFYGLRDWRARDIALLNRDVARLERRSAAADLVLQVAQQFFTTVAAAEELDVRQTTRELLQAQLKVAERRFEVGEVTLADVARWRAEVAAADQQVVVARGIEELARGRLARLAGVPAIGRLRPPGPVPVSSTEIDPLVELAYANRPEIATLIHQLEAAGMYIRVEKGAWLPELDAHAQYYQQKAAFPSSDWLSLTLNLRVPIYDGGLAAARVAKAREDLQEIRLLESEIRKGIADQVESSAIQYRSAVAAHQAAVTREKAAREAQRQVEKAYRVGEASATDLLVTTTDLSDAESSVILARWQRELGAIGLRHAVGDLPLPDVELTPEDTNAPAPEPGRSS